MTTISMDTFIIGMAVRGRTIYYSAWDERLKMLNFSDKSRSDIISSNTSYVNYIHCNYISGADPRFQVRGAHLKKIGPSGGRREICWGISCEKSRFYAKKSYFFQF
jgi:hypothetical protein